MVYPLDCVQQFLQRGGVGGKDADCQRAYGDEPTGQVPQLGGGEVADNRAGGGLGGSEQERQWAAVNEQVDIAANPRRAVLRRVCLRKPYEDQRRAEGKEGDQ